MSITMYPCIKECPICGKKDSSHNADSGFERIIIQCSVCGKYKIAGSLELFESSIKNDERKYILSAMAREAYETNQSIIEFDSFNTEEYLTDGRIQMSISEKGNRILRYIDLHTKYASQYININYYDDYPSCFSVNASEFHYLAAMLKDRGLIDLIPMESTGAQVRLTPRGWERIDELKEDFLNGKKCFVAMWFDDTMSDAYLRGIEPAIRDVGYEPFRVDKSEHNGKICDRIIAELRQSRIMIADFTGHRGGVYFEAGFAMGLGRPVIWTCRKNHIKRCHFDTRQYNHIVWESPEDLKEKLYHRIMATVPLKKQ